MSDLTEARRIPLTIDPGHKGGYNKGATYEIEMGSQKWYYEGTKMFEKAQYLQQYLNAYGIFKAVLTKTKLSECPSLEARGKMAINNGSRAIISLHTNGANGSVGGTEVLASVARRNYKSVADGLTKTIVDTLKSLGDTDAKIRSTVFKKNKSNDLDYYGLQRNAVSAPGVEHVYLIEAGFHDNPVECDVLIKSENLKALAKAEAEYLYELMKDLYLDPDIATYMTKTTASVNVRVKPTTDSLILGTIQAGDSVEYIGDENSDWVKVLYRHCICYMSRKYIKIPEIPEFDPKPDPTPVVPPVVDDSIKLVDGVVNASVGLNVRSEPDAKSNRLKTLTNKSKITIDLTHSSIDWYALYPYPISGYVSRQWVGNLTNERTVKFSSTNPDVVEPDKPKTLTGIVTAQAGLNMRTQPNTKSTIITTLRYNERVIVHSMSDGWAQVSNEKLTGYVSTVYLSIADDSDIDPIVVDAYKVNCSVLNVRNGPGTTYSKVGSLTKGTIIEATSIEGQWVKFTNSKFKNCYVHSQYLTKIPDYKSPLITDTTLYGSVLNLMHDYEINASTWFKTLLNAKISSGYGYRTHPITGVKQSFHQGIDYAANAGTPIFTPISGVVVANYYNTSYGNLLIIQNVSDDSRHYFAHQKVLPLPKVGDAVARGSLIGYVGTTGSSTGNHLHYEIRLPKNGYKLYTDNINPDTYKYLK